MNIAPLLEPISPSEPAGVDLRSVSGDLTLIRLRDLRREVSPEEDLSVRQGDAAKAPGKEADWPGIVECCLEALGRRTKDVEIAASLAEAWMRLEGFSGLARGLTLIRELSERFWDHLHPGVEQGEMIQPLRARPYGWIGSSGVFQQSLLEAPLLQRPGKPALSWYDQSQAQRLEQMRLTQPAMWRDAQKDSPLSLADFEAAAAAVPPHDLRETLDAVERCRREVAALTTFTEKHFHADEAPLLLPLRDVIDEIAEFLRLRVPTLRTPQAAEIAEVEVASPITEVAESALQPTSSAIQSRAEALRRLGELAEYFRKTEPHSPVSYLVERAVRWGDMPLDQLLQEVVKDQGVLNHIRDTLGIRPPEK